MKRELVALLVILTILSGSIYNAYYVKKQTKELRDQLVIAQLNYQESGKAVAGPMVADALNNWLNWRKYAHIMLRHSEVDSVTESYYELLSEVERDSGNVPASSFGIVEQKLHNISEMEQLTLGSIL